jgi:hypothetical protein
MIEASGELDGRPMMLLGLSGENVTRLVAGEPIVFDGDEVGYAGKVVIVYGNTEEAIAQQFDKPVTRRPPDR